MGLSLCQHNGAFLNLLTSHTSWADCATEPVNLFCRKIVFCFPGMVVVIFGMFNIITAIFVEATMNGLKETDAARRLGCDNLFVQNQQEGPSNVSPPNVKLPCAQEVRAGLRIQLHDGTIGEVGHEYFQTCLKHEESRRCCRKAPCQQVPNFHV